MEFITNIEAIIIMYSPVALCYFTQIVSWIVTFLKVKHLNISEQIAPLVDKVESLEGQIKNLIKENETFIKDKEELSVAVGNLRQEVSDQAELIKETNEYLKKLSIENVELKAELRRKSCTIEQENV